MWVYCKKLPGRVLEWLKEGRTPDGRWFAFGVLPASRRDTEIGEIKETRDLFRDTARLGHAHAQRPFRAHGVALVRDEPYSI